MKVIFSNAGLIDLKAIQTFGANVKVNDSPIGYFGTGLKYAIAVLLANNCTLTLYRGHEQIEFTARKELIRDKEFSVCYMGETALGFTTELGKNWKVWQAFRELYCNSMDEGGSCFTAYAASDVINDNTTTFVAGGEAVLASYNARSEIILLTAPIVETPNCNIHAGESKYLFYKGVRVYEAASAPFRYTYNLQGTQSLTEDRTLAYTWSAFSELPRAIMQSSNKEVIRKFLLAGKQYMEGAIDFSSNTTPSAAFLEVVKDCRIKREISLNLSALKFYDSEARKEATPQTEELNAVQKAQLDYAISICHTLGAVVKDYPIIVSTHLGDHVLGLAEDGKIFISKRAFDMGDNMVAATLYEEYVHLKFGYSDESRGMQNFLFERLVGTASLLQLTTKLSLKAA